MSKGSELVKSATKSLAPNVVWDAIKGAYRLYIELVGGGALIGTAGVVIWQFLIGVPPGFIAVLIIFVLWLLALTFVFVAGRAKNSTTNEDAETDLDAANDLEPAKQLDAKPIQSAEEPKKRTSIRGKIKEGHFTRLGRVKVSLEFTNHSTEPIVLKSFRLKVSRPNGLVFESRGLQWTAEEVGSGMVNLAPIYLNRDNRTPLAPGDPKHGWIEFTFEPHGFPNQYYELFNPVVFIVDGFDETHEISEFNRESFVRRN